MHYDTIAETSQAHIPYNAYVSTDICLSFSTLLCCDAPTSGHAQLGHRGRLSVTVLLLVCGMFFIGTLHPSSPPSRITHAFLSLYIVLTSCLSADAEKERDLSGLCTPGER